jgi:GST-like protein
LRQEKMSVLFYAATSNGQKITLFLEEAELARRLIRVDISKGEHYRMGHNAHQRQQIVLDNDPAVNNRFERIRTRPVAILALAKAQ